MSILTNPTDFLWALLTEVTEHHRDYLLSVSPAHAYDTYQVVVMRHPGVGASSFSVSADSPTDALARHLLEAIKKANRASHPDF